MASGLLDGETRDEDFGANNGADFAVVRAVVAIEPDLLVVLRVVTTTAGVLVDAVTAVDVGGACSGLPTGTEAVPCRLMYALEPDKTRLTPTY